MSYPNYTTFTTGSINSLDSLLPANQRNLLWQSHWQDYQNRVDKLLCMYDNDWELFLSEYIQSKMNEESRRHFFPYGKTPLVNLPTQANILKFVVQQLSKIYMNEARRRFVEEIEPDEIEEGDTVQDIAEDQAETQFENNERFEEIVSSIGYNSIMQDVNELTNLCGTVLVRPVPDESKESGFRIDIMTPDQFEPILHPKKPGELIGVSYVIDATDSNGLYSDTRYETVIYMGTEEEEAFWAERTNNEDNYTKQPYPWVYNGEKYLPFVVFRNKNPRSGQFVNRFHGMDLYNATLEYAALLSGWEKGYKTGTFKQLAVVGKSEGFKITEQIMDSTAIISFPMDKEDGQVTQLDHTVDVEKHLKALDDFASISLRNYGLSIDDFKGTPQSGVSIKLQNQTLIDLITMQKSIFRKAEKELAEVIRKENNRALPSGKFGPISDNARFEIDFGDLPFDESIEEKQPFYDWAVLNNIMSKAEVALINNPDLGTLENAQEQVIKNSVLNREATRGQSQTPTLNLAPIPTTGEEETPEDENPPPVQQTTQPEPLITEETP